MGRMNTIYYVELNLICIILLLLVRNQSRHKTEQMSTTRMVFHRIIWTSIVLCLSDMVSGGLRGQTFAGARALLELGNIVYFEAIVVIGYSWMIYVRHKLKGTTEIKSRGEALLALPLLVFTLVALTNPFTHILFTLDENNIYARNVGVYLHWLVSWGYLILPTVQTARAVCREPNKLKRQDILPLLYFIIAPVVAGVAQMLFYGLSATQVGVTISVVMIFLSVQGNQILTDALTGLNNRRGLHNYLAGHIQHYEGAALSVLMIDVNRLKHVNDKYGHLAGDLALQETADALKQACRGLTGRPFLCRYGGDEFVIAGLSGESEITRLIELIRLETARKKLPGAIDVPLEVSIGAATGECMDMEDAERLLREADEAMYADKKRLAGARE